MRWTVLVAITIGALTEAPAWGCSCEPMEPPSPARIAAAAANGRLIYVGVVTAVDSTTNAGMLTYSVDVEATLGGVHHDVQLVSTRDSEAACGVRLTAGDRYLLFPDTGSSDAREFGIPTVGLCGAQWQIIRDPAFIFQVLATTAVGVESWGSLKVAACLGLPSDR